MHVSMTSCMLYIYYGLLSVIILCTSWPHVLVTFSIREPCGVSITHESYQWKLACVVCPSLQKSWVQVHEVSIRPVIYSYHVILTACRFLPGVPAFSQTCQICQQKYEIFRNPPDLVLHQAQDSGGIVAVPDEGTSSVWKFALSLRIWLWIFLMLRGNADYSSCALLHVLSISIQEANQRWDWSCFLGWLTPYKDIHYVYMMDELSYRYMYPSPTTLYLLLYCTVPWRLLPLLTCLEIAWC
jgi:hypothetical protein